MSRINISRFRTPRAVCTPGYFWATNDALTKEKVLPQLEDMRAHGVRTLCLHPCPQEWDKNSKMEPDYLSDEYMKVIKWILDECKRLGMCFYLYDEGGFPSGSAAGRVFNTDRDAFAQQRVERIKGTDKVRFLKLNAPNPCGFPNLLNEKATERFIELTHKRFAKYAKKHFGSTIVYTFTDEPRIPGTMMNVQLSWCDDFGKEFKKRKGYAVEPCLPKLCRSPRNTDSKQVQQWRVDYYDVCSQLFLERYLQPIQKWCHANGLKASGHFAGEDSPCGNLFFGYVHILRSMRGLDMPGVDVIWRQLYPVTRPALRNVKLVPRCYDPVTSGSRSHAFTKYASSIAHQKGENDVLSETFAVYGSGLMPCVMRWLTDYQLLRGANRFVLSNIPQNPTGVNMLGCRPYFGPVNPLWDYFDLYHIYTARMSELLSSGKPVVETAFYHDIRSIWVGAATMRKAIKIHETTSEALLQHQIDFDYIDDDALKAAKIEGKSIRIGKMLYKTLVIPETKWMEADAKAKIAAFKKADGKVVAPEKIDTIAPTLKISPANEWIRVQKRVYGDEVLYFVVNEGPDSADVVLHIPEAGELQRFNAENGKRYSLNREGKEPLAWHFAPYDSVVIVANPAGAADLKMPVYRTLKKWNLKDGWTLRTSRNYYVTKDHYAHDDKLGKPMKAALGDWRKYVGEDFSGEAIYATEFQWTKKGVAYLDLGKVSYSCKVLVNGREIGRKFWGPFEFVIPAEVLKDGKNTLEVKVTNTYANAIQSKKTQDMWDKYYPEMHRGSLYEVYEKSFEKDSLPSGLFGPVVLSKKKRLN